MIELVRSPWSERFEQLIAESSSSLVLSSPYIGAGPCNSVRRHAVNKGNSFTVLIITDLSRDNMLCGGVDIAALATLAMDFPQANVRFLPSLHAKVYIADDKRAVVTSANMTDAGLRRNFEYGVDFRDSTSVACIRQDVMQYASLGSPIESQQLNQFAAVVGELREMLRSVERTTRSRLRREFEQRILQVDEDVLRARAAGRSVHAIFANAILHLLRKGPMRTVQIHEGIKDIHPDLCDDSIDRIIDGQHYGKKWKHNVRTAQVHLKRRCEIRLNGRHWELVGSSSAIDERDGPKL